MSPLAVDHLSVSYGGRPALSDVTWRAAPGLTAIIGPNGAGKSTLLKAILGLVPHTGSVRFFGGATLDQVRLRVGYLPQRQAVDWDFPASALDVVAMARRPHSRWWGPLPRAQREAARAALAEVGLAELADRPIGQLSGGQQQRVFLARTLAQGADLLLMDEPLAAVDAATEQTIIAILKRLAAEGRSVIAVHHDLSTVPQMFEHALLLNGRVVAAGPVREVLTPALIAATYGTVLPA
ncbi:MAG: metal ABC transporter ATP-binding protein [Rhodovarius sp.]|nr:metal ABC transporter ATP-binding protein [Rhodovarius sp.]MCX7932759.1 metal ABC transporter ATP-binding protein [Rhodovarius sp.]MDW8315626.1 metal ABC transporter ATP-binding protein [Rhodovarius sp.]